MIPDKRRAFTLAELMIAVLILGVLTAIAIPRITAGTFQANVNVCRNNIDAINEQLELYHATRGSWPVTLKEVVNDPNIFPDGPPQCPFKIPYVMVSINGVCRVSKHIHLVNKEVKTLAE
ncbi:MAG: prepilin-type N-terminal cleavage/methylation domain-containing protein [Sedimentisphaerales bacterium]|nr:prepilin-type N-terminal cleavage/methylation domain-containing protein [Sedimentisphaerales bacterium]